MTDQTDQTTAEQEDASSSSAGVMDRPPVDRHGEQTEDTRLLYVIGALRWKPLSLPPQMGKPLMRIPDTDGASPLFGSLGRANGHAPVRVTQHPEDVLRDPAEGHTPALPVPAPDAAPPESARPSPGDDLVTALKARAGDLRLGLKVLGRALAHGQALDLLARLHNLHDWNTLSARPETPLLRSPAAGPALNLKLAQLGHPALTAAETHALLGETERRARPLPVPAVSWTPPPPFDLSVQEAIDEDAYRFGGETGDEDDDQEHRASMRRVLGLAENLDDWAVDLEATLPGLTAWAQRQWAKGRHHRPSAEDLLDWIFDGERQGVLMFSEAHRRENGQTCHVSFHPSRWISGLWSYGETRALAEADAWRQVRAYWTQPG